jgi:hypothetical protein
MKHKSSKQKLSIEKLSKRALSSAHPLDSNLQLDSLCLRLERYKTCSLGLQQLARGSLRTEKKKINDRIKVSFMQMSAAHRLI